MERTVVKIAADGSVGASVVVYRTDDATDAVPDGYLDITNDPDRDAILAHTKSWDGSRWIDAPAPVVTPALDLSALTDRAILEAIARAVGL